jgi:hypothetical protein
VNQILSGLSDGCREYVGARLIIRFEGGWGWTVHCRDEWGGSYEGEDVVSGTFAEVIPTAFFAQQGASTRGFSGRVVRPGHPLDQMPIVAITMSDGYDHNFTNRRASWRFWLGHGELVCPDDSFPRVRGEDIIAGYGSISAWGCIFGRGGCVEL